MSKKKSGFSLLALPRQVAQTVSFVLLLMFYVGYKLTLQRVLRWTKQVKIDQWCMSIFKAVDLHPARSVSRLDLIDLSLRNLKARKTRSLVTIGGMSIGISIIVFLVSIGYGLQQVVVSRIARLDEMRQTTVSTQPGSQLQLTQKTVADLTAIPHVSQALPQIAAVSQVTYEQSQADIAAYGVTTEYLKQSAIQPSFGQIFDSQQISVAPSPTPSPTPNVSPTPAFSPTEGAEPISLPSTALRQAVVNQAMLQLLTISPEQAVGKTFTSSFIANITNSDNTIKVIQSLPTDYTIVGVIAGDDSPLFYLPFSDLRSLGLDQFDQIKVAVDSPEDLSEVRRLIEVQGYATQSVVDTVSQVNTLFQTLRTLLVILGIGALFVAALGMFNTLTVSLLERTREVGLMKSMGMRSFEVRQLFLTESMIMGLAGGVMGLLLGLVVGKLLTLGLSILSIAQGSDFIDVSVVPWAFALAITLISLLVGFLTGLFPARRATRISALNAMRYE